MEREQKHATQTPNESFARRIGEVALCTCAVYVGLKIGQEIVGYNLSEYIEIGVASGIGTTIANVSQED